MRDEYGLDDRDYTAEAIAENLTEAGFYDEFAIAWVRGYAARVWDEGYRAGYKDRSRDRGPEWSWDTCINPYRQEADDDHRP